MPRIKKRPMSESDIIQIFESMGLGNQEQRDKLLSQVIKTETDEPTDKVRYDSALEQFRGNTHWEITMPSWNDLLEEVKAAGSTYDVVRRKYLRKLHEVTDRNVIVYYSGWLQKGGLRAQGVGFELNDSDKNGFMAAIHGLDRSKGLDLLLHTPGGETAATESLVDYLRGMFGTDIRAIIPQIALSAGTMSGSAGLNLPRKRRRGATGLRGRTRNL